MELPQLDSYCRAQKRVRQACNINSETFWQSVLGFGLVMSFDLLA